MKKAVETYLFLRPALLSTLLLAATILLIGCGGEERSSRADQATAERLVTEGRLLWETRRAPDLVSSLDYFQRAAKLDPESAQAWAGVADASALLGLYGLIAPKDTMPRALDAGKRALALDTGTSSTFASLGLAQYLYAWDFPSAEHSFQRAIELDGDNSSVRHWYAMMLSALGRDHDAMQQMETAAALAPSSPLLNTKLVTILTAAGELDRAESAAQSAAQRFPDYSLVQREIGFLRIKQGRFDEAADAFRRSLDAGFAEGPQGEPEPTISLSLRNSGNTKTLAALSHSLARSGEFAKAEVLLEALLARRATEHVSPMAIAHALAGLGRFEEAFRELQQALREKDPGLVYLYTKAGFEQLGERRLAALASEMGLRPVA